MPSEYFCHNVCPDKYRELCPLPRMSQRLLETGRLLLSLSAYSAAATQSAEGMRQAAKHLQALRAKQKARGEVIITCIQVHEAAEDYPPLPDP